MQDEIKIIPIYTIGSVSPGDDLSEILIQSLRQQNVKLFQKDILIITQKVVSKAEGRIVDLNSITPSEFALKTGKMYKKDPRYVELILRESKRIVRMDHGVIISETHHGFICANAGVDMSNTGDSYTASLLPVDPDASARRIQVFIHNTLRIDTAVIITDTWGRPWREGQVNFAIGIAGLNPFIDYRGQKDQYGFAMRASIIAVADELAGASELVMGKTYKVPAAIVRGYKFIAGKRDAKGLLRKTESDMFR